jgi:hypothetical protein
MISAAAGVERLADRLAFGIAVPSCEHALGREGMSEVSGIAAEVREMVDVLKDRTVLPF